MQNRHSQLNFLEMDYVCGLVLIILLPDPCDKRSFYHKNFSSLDCIFCLGQEYTEINTKFRFSLSKYAANKVCVV